MISKAATVEEYLAELPEERRIALSAIREVILKNLPKGIEEQMQYGMIGYCVPHSVFPPGYHCDPKQPLPYGGLASQKNHISIYLFCMYVNEPITSWFVEEYSKTGQKLDMGKGCLRFKRLDQVPLDLIGEVIKKMTLEGLLQHYSMWDPRQKKK